MGLQIITLCNVLCFHVKMKFILTLMKVILKSFSGGSREHAVGTNGLIY